MHSFLCTTLQPWMRGDDCFVRDRLMQFADPTGGTVPVALLHSVNECAFDGMETGRGMIVGMQWSKPFLYVTICEIAGISWNQRFLFRLRAWIADLDPQPRTPEITLKGKPYAEADWAAILPFEPARA